MESETSADPAVLWLRARQLCYLGGHVPQSGEIVGILRKLKDDMPTDLADFLKAGEEDGDDRDDRDEPSARRCCGEGGGHDGDGDPGVRRCRARPHRLRVVVGAVRPRRAFL